MAKFGYPYNDLVICKDSTDYLCHIKKLIENGVLISIEIHIEIHIVTRCTRGDARSLFCTYKTYLYAQNYFLKNIFKYCFKSYIKLHEYGNCNSANYDV